MMSFLTFLHVGICIILIIAVLLQAGSSSGLSGLFGGGSSQSVFGNRGATTFLSKITTFAAVGFFVTTLLLAILSGRGEQLNDVSPVPTSQSSQGK